MCIFYIENTDPMSIQNRSSDDLFDAETENTSESSNTSDGDDYDIGTSQIKLLHVFISNCS